LSDQIEKNMGGACKTCGERRCAYRILMWKPVGKRHLGRPRRSWEDNIKMGLQEVG
jgi:DNA-directed RNA polymerase subunit RPC12/RpoP